MVLRSYDLSRAWGVVILLAAAATLSDCSTNSLSGGFAAAMSTDAAAAVEADVAGQRSPISSDASQAGRGNGSGPEGGSTQGGNRVALDASGAGDGTGPVSEAGLAEASPPADAGTAGYEPCPTDGSNCKVLPLGDSITYGIQYPGAYRVQLFQDAVMDQKKLTFVGDSTLANGPTMVAGMPFPQNNQGHSGWTIDQIKGIVPAPALNDNPDIILLLIGTNDMYSQTQPVAQAPQRLGALLDAIGMGDPHALIAVAQITPLQNSTWEANVMAYNAAIPAIVQARTSAGAHIILVDQHTGFQSSTMLSSDGVHPNRTGYDHMGDVWYTAIRDVLP